MSSKGARIFSISPSSSGVRSHSVQRRFFSSCSMEDAPPMMEVTYSFWRSQFSAISFMGLPISSANAFNFLAPS